MFGKWGITAMAFALVVTSCAHNVKQDAKSGPDGKMKGAREMIMENGEARSKDIVTYPGGDRVDWKVVELPEGKKGVLEISLKWRTPRPKLQLAFDVFDEWNTPVIQSKKTNKRRSTTRIKSRKIDNAKGKYFIRVYAVGRGDAGAYTLKLDFAEKNAVMFDPLALEIPEPPRLAAVPEPELPCDPMAFDQKNPACKMVCPEFGAPPGWPACRDKCPNPPDVNLPQCQATMPCPNPPDRRVKSCKATMWPKCNLAAKDPMNPNCDNAKADPITARVLKQQVQGNDLIITIGAGSNSGVGKGWSATVLRAGGDDPLSGGEITIVRVDKTTTIGKVRLTADQLKQNDRIRLSPP